ncbi:Trk system potassium transporter TrkA [Marinospirillum sp. MEB164]|uniref:Trk system potassium uptake protein TrkA n=1 Tax=Marinospirillum alkalitolerans TaxID=3123374 RepID=A0ABW8PT60_9GAMM
MKIIILGAGQVGGTLAENLASEENDITMIDSDANRLRDLQNKLDIRIVQGKASYPAVLREAGCEDADMLIAVTNSDEVNMVACQVAHALFNTPSKIARVRSAAYLSRKGLFRTERGFDIDVLISPEQVVTNHIRRLIEYPGALQVLDFAGGLVQLVAVKAYYGGPLIGQKLATLREHIPDVPTRVAAIYRQNQALIPTGDTVVQVDDEVFFIAARKDIRTVMSEMRKVDHSYRRIVIAGGGNIGERLAESLENEYQVKLIEYHPQRCTELADKLSRTVVLHGTATDKNLLQEESIEEADIFCAVTNDDEVNIMSSMLAKRMGAGKVMTLINNAAYVDLVQGGEVDIAFSPQLATIGSLLTHVRRGQVKNVHSLRRGAAEAIEAVALGDKSSSKIVGRPIGIIQLPEGVTIGALVREKEVMMASDDLVIESGDQVILFLVDKRKIREVEQLFAVGVTFI